MDWKIVFILALVLILVNYNRLIKLLKKSDFFAWVFTLAGMALMIYIGLA
jgi:hypothetical protein